MTIRTGFLRDSRFKSPTCTASPFTFIVGITKAGREFREGIATMHRVNGQVKPNGDRQLNQMVVQGVEDFWERIDTANSVVLMLDFDGTLAPFHVDRMQARPLPRVLDALRAIRGNAHAEIIIVSGRPIAEVQSLLGDAELTIVGSHGYEVYVSGEGARDMPVSPEQQTLLDAAFANVTRIFPRDRVERKVASVAAHFRGLPLAERQNVELAIASAMQPSVANGVTELRAFNGGLELRAIGRSKGTAVEEVLAGFPGDALAVYIGDDDTDEDAFAALPATGIGIKVGPSDTTTVAVGRLPDCAAVEQLLVNWSTRRDVS